MVPHAFRNGNKVKSRKLAYACNGHEGIEVTDTQTN